MDIFARRRAYEIWIIQLFLISWEVIILRIQDVFKEQLLDNLLLPVCIKI